MSKIDSYSAFTIRETWRAVTALQCAAVIIERCADEYNDTWCEDHAHTVGYDKGQGFENAMRKVNKDLSDIISRMAEAARSATEREEMA